MRSYSKGASKERALAEKFWKLGFAVVRAPASGAKLKRWFSPDLTVMYKGRILAFEVKYKSSGSTVYVDCNKVNKLIDFANRAGGEAYILVNFGDGWLYKKPSKCTGSFSVKRSEVDGALDSLIKGIVNFTLF